MPRRPPSLQFPLRHRRTTSAATTEDGTESQSPTTATSAPTSAPNRPLIASPGELPVSAPPPKSSKRRSLVFGTSSAPPTKAVTAAAALQTRAELRSNVRTDWHYPSLYETSGATYGETGALLPTSLIPLPGDDAPPTSRVQPDTVYAERALDLSSPSPSPSPPPFASFGRESGFVPMVRNGQVTAPPPSQEGLPIARAEDADINDKRADPEDAFGNENASRREDAPPDGSTDADPRPDDEESHTNPYRFDSPDAVGTSITRRRTRRAAQQRLERQQNAGLRHWEDQRNAWTGAVLVPRNEATGVVRHSELHDDAAGDGESESVRAIKRRRHLGANGTSARTSTSTSDNAAASSSSRPATASTATSHPPSSSSSAPPSSTAPHSSRKPDDDRIPLVPHPPPLISATHPIRSQIAPHAYRSIYTRIVVQGTAPAVPVNLGDIIAACVVGWKADGEWPPRGTLPAHLPSHAPATGLPAAPAPKGTRIATRHGDVGLAAAVLGPATAGEIRALTAAAAAAPGPPRRRTRAASALVGAGSRRGGGVDLTAEPTAAALALGWRGAGARAAGAEGFQVDATTHDGGTTTEGALPVGDRRFAGVGRSVRRVGRALKAAGSAMLEPESEEADALEREVPGLVQGALGGTFDKVEIGGFERREL